MAKKQHHPKRRYLTGALWAAALSACALLPSTAVAKTTPYEPEATIVVWPRHAEADGISLRNDTSCAAGKACLAAYLALHDDSLNVRAIAVKEPEEAPLLQEWLQDFGADDIPIIVIDDLPSQALRSHDSLIFLNRAQAPPPPATTSPHPVLVSVASRGEQPPRISTVATEPEAEKKSLETPFYNGGSVSFASLRRVGWSQRGLALAKVMAKADNVLKFKHRPVRGFIPFPSSDITIRSGISPAQNVRYSRVRWRKKGDSDWKTVAMSERTSEEFIAEIPIRDVSARDTVEYFIEAETNSGRKHTRPLDAPQTPYSFFFTPPSSSGSPASSRLTVGTPYPNPSGDDFLVPVELNGESTVEFRIVNVLGFEVRRTSRGRNSAGSYLFDLGVGGLPEGIYFLNVFINGRRHTVHKIIKR